MKTLLIGIFVIVSTFRTGDNNQIDGIVEEFKKLMVNSTSELANYSKFEDIYELISKLTNSSNDVNVVVGVGRLGVGEILKLQKEKLNKNILFLWSGHQMMPGMLQMHPDTIISLPKYAVNDQIIERFNNIIPMLGVANNTTKDKLLAALKKHSVVSNIREPITLVILPGDAPDRSGRQNLYTDEEAIQLADYISMQVAKEMLPRRVVVTNGPRTGKHDKKTKKILNVHGKNIKNSDSKVNLDYVTHAFCERLKQTQTDYELYNFDFRFLPSAYYSLLGCANSNNGSKIFVPRASSSMISEIADIFPVDSYMILEGSNMNVVHHRNVDIRFSHGAKVIKHINGQLQLKLNNRDNVQSHHKSGALCAAEYLITEIARLPI